MENSNPGKDVSDNDLITKLPLATDKKKRIQPVSVKGVEFRDKNFVVMAGPNLVESEEMIIKIAQAVKNSGADMLRGGAYKPLTFPYRSAKYFESEEQGLKWLKAASLDSGLPTVSEVTTVRNLEKVCNYVDMIQIGTRNMQNYDLLIEAAKTMKPILLKRGYGASLRDFLGAAEYILNEGNFQLVLCERGIVAPHTHRNTSRFLLDLQIVPALKELSFLPIITDPSHATFWAQWVPSMSLASLAAGANGIMIEVHPTPSEAAVDPLQPLDFENFDKLMKTVRKVKSVL
jgi:3-deoxy-7-phosphoheptulonate synthase